MKKVAKIVERNVKPAHAHDCADCRFLGRLNGEDLYACRKTGRATEYLRRFGSHEADYGSLGDLTPEGSPYSLARQIHARFGTVAASLAPLRVPNAWVADLPEWGG